MPMPPPVSRLPSRPRDLALKWLESAKPLHAVIVVCPAKLVQPWCLKRASQPWRTQAGHSRVMRRWSRMKLDEK